MFIKQHGIILVTCLIFLFIFMLLALSTLTTSLLQTRMGNNLAKQLQQQQAVEAGLLAGEKELLTGFMSSCIINFIAEPWLSNSNCTISFNQQIVHYVIEPLLLNNCFANPVPFSDKFVFKKNNLYRITAWIQRGQYYPLILQITYAKALAESCTEPLTELKLGRLSWREI